MDIDKDGYISEIDL